jgi:hypothetical protein
MIAKAPTGIGQIVKFNVLTGLRRQKVSNLSD